MFNAAHSEVCTKQEKSERMTQVMNLQLRRNNNMETTKILDMPKLDSPFIRRIIGGNYVVTPEINPDYQWVFDDDTVIASEKLHGTNVSIVIQEGAVVSVWNRTERIPFINKNKSHIIEGVQ